MSCKISVIFLAYLDFFITYFSELAMPRSETLIELKQMISLRLVESDRTAIQAVASRLFVRESDIYRLAINYLLGEFSCLLDENSTGSDLLLAMCEIRAELNHTLGLKKHQLEKIINGNNLHPDKYVAMSDIELLLMPQHLLKQHLTKVFDNPKNKLNLEDWLKEYIAEKYKLVIN